MSTPWSGADGERLRAAVRELAQLERPVRVLRTVGWAPEVRARFFAAGARELPRVDYAPLADAEERARRAEAVATGFAGDGDVPRWVARQAAAIAGSARMLGAVGTPRFHEHSVELFGAPSTALDGQATSLDLARQLDGFARDLAGLDLGAPAPACHLASAVQACLREAVRARFGDAAPEVVVVESLSANALAGPTRILLRRDACFSDRDVDQLVQHEAFVHVCTFLNGQAQPDLPLLAAGHAGTTRSQEGLAVFAEFITGSLDPDRFRRLADRVLAIQMAIEGADFLQVYRWYCERTNEEQAFENARRVFRGGVLTGGAPFTKDVVYLAGLIGVTNFLRAAVAEGRVDGLELCFCGKLDLEDLPALAELARAGLCRPPRFLPPWLEDRRYLVTYLTYSRFLNGVDLSAVRARVRRLLEGMGPPRAQA